MAVEYVQIVGAIGGGNLSFTLMGDGLPVKLFRSGLIQSPGLDYSQARNSVTFSLASAPQSGDVLVAVADASFIALVGPIVGSIVIAASSTFTMATPPSSLELYRNGVIQTYGVDFLSSGMSITFLPASTPQIGDVLVAVSVDASTFASLDGVMDGTNRAFTLGSSPGAVELYRNGSIQAPGVDYSISGTTVTFASYSVPQPGDLVIAIFPVSIVPAAYVTTVTAQQIYTMICYDLLEDGGLVLGLVTAQQFMDMLNETVFDFLTATGIAKVIYTQSIFAGQRMYPIPDDVMRVDDAFLAGHYLPQTTMRGLNNSRRNWRRTLDIPTGWHEDGLPIKTLELAPGPNYTGLYIPGPSEPDPPHAAYGSWWVPAYPATGGAAVVQSPQATRSLTMVGPQAPTVTAGLADVIPLIPDDICLAAIPFGILYRIFSGDNEEKDNSRADFCQAEYLTVVNLLRAVSGEYEQPQ